MKIVPAPIYSVVISAAAICALLAGPPVFSQGTDDGLTLRQMLFSALENNSLDGAIDAVVSSDGQDVYVAARDSNGIAHFVRDADAGTLTFEAIYPGQVPGGAGPQPVFELAISPDDAFIFVALGASGTLPPGILRFDRDGVDGTLTFGQFFEGGAMGTVGLAGPRLLARSPSGNHLYVYSVGDGIELASLTVLATDPDTGAITFVERRVAEIAQQDGLSDTQQITVSPDGRHVYTAGGTEQGIGVYERNLQSGVLTFVTFVSLLPPSGTQNVRSVEVAPNGLHAYAALAATNEVVVFSRNDAGGNLTEIDRFSDGLARGAVTTFADRIVAAPDGARVYVISRDNSTGTSSVAAFGRDATTGLLTPLEALVDGVVGAFDLLGEGTPAVSPDSRHLYVPSSVSDTLAVFVVERPDLPCLDFPGITDEYTDFKAMFTLADDLDGDGVPEDATLALIERAVCVVNTDEPFDESIANAYLLNLITVGTETEVFDTMELVDFQRAIAALMMISDAFQTALDTELNNQGLDLEAFYAVVRCTSGNCTPARSETRAPDEPFSGEGDPDNDGFTNAEEWANTEMRGGTILEFAIAALDARFDGSTEPVDLDGDGDCFIATAAYGTPLARELYALRGWRDESLLPTVPGAAFVDTYYRLSPPLAHFIAERPALRSAARIGLAPFVGLAERRMFAAGMAVAVLFVLALWFTTRRVLFDARGHGDDQYVTR